MSYNNNNNHYTPRFNTYQSKKPHEYESSHKDSSTYSLSKIRENNNKNNTSSTPTSSSTSTSSIPTSSSSYYSRRDYHPSSNYKSRYDSYSSSSYKPASSSSSRPINKSYGTNSSYYSKRRSNDSYSKYQDNFTNKYVSKASGNFTPNTNFKRDSNKLFTSSDYVSWKRKPLSSTPPDSSLPSNSKSSIPTKVTTNSTDAPVLSYKDERRSAKPMNEEATHSKNSINSDKALDSNSFVESNDIHNHSNGDEILAKVRTTLDKNGAREFDEHKANVEKENDMSKDEGLEHTKSHSNYYKLDNSDSSKKSSWSQNEQSKPVKSVDNHNSSMKKKTSFAEYLKQSKTKKFEEKPNDHKFKDEYRSKDYHKIYYNDNKKQERSGMRSKSESSIELDRAGEVKPVLKDKDTESLTNSRIDVDHKSAEYLNEGTQDKHDENPEINISSSRVSERTASQSESWADSSALSPINDKYLNDHYETKEKEHNENVTAEEETQFVGAKSEERAPLKKNDQLDNDIVKQEKANNSDISNQEKQILDEKEYQDDSKFNNDDQPNHKDTESEDSQLSEAETIIYDTPKLNEGRVLIRKATDDEARHKLKRKSRNIVISDDEDEDRYDSASTSNSNGLNKKVPKVDYPYKMKRDSGGRSLLQRACKKGDLDAVKDFISRGASANEKDFCGFTCLHEAALEGHTQIVQYLIDHGADVNAKADEAGDSETPLIDASENKHTETVKILLKHGADPTIYNIDGFTALTKIFSEHSNEEGYDDIIVALENAISNLNNKKNKDYYITKSKSGTPETNGIIDDPYESYFADLIKKKGIYKYAAENAKESTANFFVSGNSLEDKSDILILAARNGHCELVDIILGLNPYQFDIDTENPCGVSALLASVGRGHIDIVQSLLSKGADPFKVRRIDGLNSLKIAQHSAKFDVDEVNLITKFMEEKPLKNHTSPGSSRPISRIASRLTSRKSSIQNSDNNESSDDEMLLDREEKSELKPNIDLTAMVDAKRERLEVDDDDDDDDNQVRPIKKSKSESISSPIENHYHQTSVFGRANRGSLSPSPSSMTPEHQLCLTKEQEELKIRNAEEARIWQEKVEAKKKARKENFLKHEKEKELKKKEEELERLKEESRLAKLMEEERTIKAHDAKKKALEVQTQKITMIKQFTLENYPPGLKAIDFNSNPTKYLIDRYLPLYIFIVNGERYVTDLQISLLTLTTINKLYERVNIQKPIPASQVEKSKLWKIFCAFIGEKKSFFESTNSVELMEFQNLLINFVNLDSMVSFLKDQFPLVHDLIASRKSIEVALESFCEFDADNANNSKLELSDDRMEMELDLNKIDKFIPPSLTYRKEIYESVGNSTRSLW